ALSNHLLPVAAIQRGYGDEKRYLSDRDERDLSGVLFDDADEAANAGLRPADHCLLHTILHRRVHFDLQARAQILPPADLMEGRRDENRRNIFVCFLFLVRISAEWIVLLIEK